MAARLAGPRIPAGGVGLPPGPDDPLRVVPEARQKAERTPQLAGLLGRHIYFSVTKTGQLVTHGQQ
jgi:hypothetical protein